VAKWTALILVALPLAAGGADNPVRPQLRVEVGAHTGYIKKLTVSPQGNRLLTVSDDKTARVWDARTGSLISVLRVPFDGPLEGRLYAATFLQRGRYAYVAGFTPARDHPNDPRDMIYGFKTDTGEMSGRVELPTLTSPANSAILTLAADEQTLAVAQRGLVSLINIGQSKVTARLTRRLSDAEPLDASFSPNGDLALTTYDGFLYVYRAASGFSSSDPLKLPIANPIDVQFSPDGHYLAVGFEAEPTIIVFNSGDLKPVFQLRAPLSAGQKGLSVFDWSDDGRFIVGGGEPRDRKYSPLFRWKLGGSGEPSQFAATIGRVSDIRRLPGGGFAFTSSQPEVAVANKEGLVQWRVSPRTYDFGSTGTLLVASADAHKVTLYSGSGNTAVSFDLDAPPEIAMIRIAVEAVPRAPPLQGTWRIEAAGEAGNATALKVNGNRVTLDDAEHVRTWTYAPDGRTLFVGTAWSIYAVDEHGASRWHIAAPDDTRALAVSADGTYVVAAFGDGTIRWYRTDDAAEVCAFLPPRVGSAWVAWIPSGYYESSPNGDELIGWQINRSVDLAPRFYRAVQFERSFYAPDLVRAYFAQHGKVSASEFAKLEGATSGGSCRTISDCLPPDLDIQIAREGNDRAQVRMSTDTSVVGWNIFVNGLPAVSSIIHARYRIPTVNDPIEVRLTGRTNTIRVEATNGKSLAVDDRFVELERDPAPIRGELYVVAIGANSFLDPGIPRLTFASNDAVAVAETLTTVSGAAFRTVHDPLLIADTSSQPATKQNIVDRVGTYLKQVGPDDTVVLFLSSHGLSNKRGEYFFVPVDAHKEDWDAVVASQDLAHESSLLSWKYFFSVLEDTAGRRILVVDTCASADISGNFDVYTLAKRSMASQFALLTASRGKERSQELQRLGHGVFTSGWLEALRTGYDPGGDGITTLKESFDYAFQMVQRNHIVLLGPQTPQFEAPEVLRNLPLAARDGRANH
jgi:WD40 repeat protein